MVTVKAALKTALFRNVIALYAVHFAASSFRSPASPI